MNLDAKYPDAFRSWIDADYWLFGLIYWIVFRDKEINLDTDWTAIVKNEISEKKANPDSSYVRSPNMLGHLRERIVRSIDLIEEHLRP